jgi:hypothetical protein
MQMHPRGRRTRQLWWANGLRAQSPPPCRRLQPLTAAPLRRLLVLAVRRWPRHADAVPVCSGLLACQAVCRVASTKARAANCTTTTVETRARRRLRRSPYTRYVLYAGAHSCRQSRVSASQRCPAASPPAASQQGHWRERCRSNGALLRALPLAHARHGKLDPHSDAQTL